jgi:hypothetical protein
MKTFNEFIGEADLAAWWNKGRDARVPNESQASWRDLMRDDRKQLTRTDRAFKAGASGVEGWRPHKAFSPGMVKTGPTPAVRQAFERPVRTALRVGGAALRVANIAKTGSPLGIAAAVLEPTPTSSRDTPSTVVLPPALKNKYAPKTVR